LASVYRLVLRRVRPGAAAGATQHARRRVLVPRDARHPGQAVRREHGLWPLGRPARRTGTTEVTEEADVVIVGSGIAGALCAWRLARRGLKVLVLEAGPRIGAAEIIAGFASSPRLDLTSGYPNPPLSPRPPPRPRGAPPPPSAARAPRPRGSPL